MSFALVKSYVLSFLLIIFFCCPSFGKTAFENPYINDDDKIVFCASRAGQGKDILVSDASRLYSSELVTCFPKKMRMISDRILEIQNDSGIARLSASSKGSFGISWVVRNKIPLSGSFGESQKSVSPDGKYEFAIKKNSQSRWVLSVREIYSSSELVIDDDPDFSASAPAKWSPDSKIALYEKRGSVYFFDINAAFSNVRGEVQLAEETRRIGEGSLRCAEFAADGTLFFMQGGFAYRIPRNELYVRAIYSSVTGLGEIAANLPLGFDFRRDDFFPSPDGEKIVIVTNGRVVSLVDVSSGDKKPLMFDIAEPHSLGASFRALWAENGDALFWVCARKDNSLSYRIYRISDKVTEIEREKVSSDFPPAVSSDGKKIAYISGTSLVVKDSASWETLGTLSGEKCVSFAWNGSGELFFGGAFTIKKWNVRLKSTETVFLSGAKEAFWDGGILVASVAAGENDASAFFEYDFSSRAWKRSGAKANGSSSQNGKFRVFLSDCESLYFSNAVSVRNLSGGETKQVFVGGMEKARGKKTLSLVFDALDSCEGLYSALCALEKYGIKAVFFLNGEFIRSYPNETRLICEAGHECANMFFAPADLTGMKGLLVDEAFVQRGLMRTEDEFFNATGKELSSKWHAPFYKADSKIKAAARKIGYKYVEAGTMPGAKAREAAAKKASHRLSANEAVSLLARSVSDGSVVFVTVGNGTSSGCDFVYDNLDFLIPELLERGFSFEK